MLLKLLKYELKSTYLRFLSAFAAYVVVMAVLLIFFRDNKILTIAVALIGGVALWALVLFNIFERYYANLYSGEGYLMFTLPVRGNKLLLAKFISAIVWVIGLCGISVAAFYTVGGVYGELTSMLTAFKLAMSELGNLTPYFVEAAVESLLGILTIFFAITVARMPIWRRLGVLMGFAAFFVIDFIRSVPGMAMVIFNLKSFISSNNSAPSSSLLNSLNIFIWVQVGFDTLLGIAVFFAITYLMDKKTSLK